MNSHQNIESFEVVIIGGGSAGIAAGMILEEHKKSYVILEGQDRLGGRTFTQDGIDLGAAWVHFSENSKNPVLGLAKKFGIELMSQSERIGEIYDEETQAKNRDQIQKEAKLIKDEFLRVLETRSSKIRSEEEDVSIRELMRDKFQEIENLENQTLRREVIRDLNQCERYEAASFSELSASFGLVYGEQSGQVNTVPRGGFGRFILKMGESLNHRLKSVIQKIDYSDEKSVVIELEGGKKIRAEQVLVTVSLGVLKSGMIQFNPPLEGDKQRFIEKMGFGLMNKVVLEFEAPFWKEESSGLSLACNLRGKFTFIRNFTPFTGRYILICFMTDDYARAQEQLSQEQILENCLSAILQCTGLKQLPKLKQHIITFWGQNRFTRGGYAHFGPGSSPRLQLAMLEPIQDRLYFAGEAVSVEFMGTVNGAILTAQQQVQKILSQLDSHNTSTDSNESI